MIEGGYLTPQQIVAELDKYIVGQHEAKRNVAIALRNRWRRMNVKSEMRDEIIPNNILMIGATGVGKTEIARRLAKIADAPFVKVEASKFTEVGYVGRDVESMVRDLVEQSVNMVKARKKEEVKERAAQIVEDIILDALIPPMRQPSKTGFVNPQQEQENQSVPTSDVELNERTRVLFREKLKNGELEERKIDINIKPAGNSNIGMIGAGMMDEVSMMNLQEMIGGMMPKKAKKRKVTVSEARVILLEEEASKLIDMDEVKEIAIRKAEDAGIILGSSLSIDYAKLDYYFTAFIGILLTKSNRTQEVLKELSSIPNVIEASVISGKYNIFCKVRAKNTDDAKRIIYQIDDIQDVMRTESMISMEEYLSDKNRLINAVSI